VNQFLYLAIQGSSFYPEEDLKDICSDLGGCTMLRKTFGSQEPL
jgi:hypothetical protein